MVCAKSLLDRSRPMTCNSAQMGLVKLAVCECGWCHIMNQIVSACPLTRFGGRLQSLHHAADYALCWLESIATTALTKMNKLADP